MGSDRETHIDTNLVEALVNEYKFEEFLDMDAYSARTAHPFRGNGAPFRFKLSKAQLVD